MSLKLAIALKSQILKCDIFIAAKRELIEFR